MSMRTEVLRALDANRAIAESRPFRGAGDDADVLGHAPIVWERGGNWATGKPGNPFLLLTCI